MVWHIDGRDDDASSARFYTAWTYIEGLLGAFRNQRR